MKEFFKVVLQWSASQQQLVVQLVLAQHSEKLHNKKWQQIYLLNSLWQTQSS